MRRPRNRSKTGRYIEWQAIVARLRERPGAWSLELPDTLASSAVSVRDRRHPALHMDDGRLEYLLQNEHVDDHGRSRGDLYLRFVYTRTPET